MTTPYGTWAIQGIQSGLPGGGGSILGPILIPFSDCQNVTNFYFPDAALAVFYIPGSSEDDPGLPTPNGLWIIPSGGSGTTLELTLGGGSPFNISPVNPTFLSFDPDHLETTFSLTAGAAMTVALQYV
jgi:hypothetical protein